MAYVAMIDEASASGRLAENDKKIPVSYGRLIPEFSPDRPD